VVRWHLLPSLGKLLFSLAQMLSAPDYKEHYRRDLGLTALQASSQGRPAFLLLVSFAMHPSLFWMSTGLSCHPRLCFSFHHSQQVRKVRTSCVFTLSLSKIRNDSYCVDRQCSHETVAAAEQRLAFKTDAIFSSVSLTLSHIMHDRH